MSYTPQPKYFSKVHIIGGELKKASIIINKDYKLRPTTNRTRKTLFSWLDPLSKGYYCLDCFAGSGSLGIETISRYSLNTTFLEINTSFYNSLLKTVNRLNLNNRNINIRLININALAWLNKVNKLNAFDLVFIDPPFYRGLITKTISLLESFNYLSHKSIIYIESEINLSNYKVPKSWSLYKSKTSNKISYKLFIRH